MLRYLRAQCLADKAAGGEEVDGFAEGVGDAGEMLGGVDVALEVERFDPAVDRPCDEVDAFGDRTVIVQVTPFSFSAPEPMPLTIDRIPYRPNRTGSTGLTGTTGWPG